MGGRTIFRRQRNTETNENVKRGWGPFTGGQLTVVIVAALLAIAFPTGLWAATATSTAITDSTGTHYAKVSASGNLQTSVSGYTNTQVAAPSQFLLQFLVDLQDTDGCVTIATAPATQALVVTQIHWVLNPNENGGVRVYDGNVCNKPNDAFDFATGSGGGDHLETFSPGMPVAAGHSIYATIRGNQLSAASGSAFVQGYYVPASQCNGGSGCG